MSDSIEFSQETMVNTKTLKPFLTCLDHTVSRETFELFIDPDLDLLVTLPRPSEADLPSYYESDAYISHTDSKASLMDKVYQYVKQYSIHRKFKLIQSLTGKKGRILDIGCGTGDLLSEFENKGWEISGVEPNDKARHLALGKMNNGSNLKSDIEELKSDGKSSYDIITMWHVLEHVPNLNEYIEVLKSLLKKEGYLIIAVPNFKSYDAKYYKEFWAAYDVPRHLWHFSEKSISAIFAQHDFKVIKKLPLIFDAYYVSLLSEKYKTGSSNVIAAIKTGFLSNIKARSNGQYSSLVYIIQNV